MNCYITYDYELCLGKRTGTPEGCLFSPMEALCDMFDRSGVRVNVFVDAAYLLRLRELMDTNDKINCEYYSVINHIKSLSDRGHSIQLHFHPQWVNALFINDSWHLDNDHYKLSDFPLNIQKEKLSQAIELLQSISNNKIIAIRAGGFSIENFKELSSFLFSKGISIDTSVLRGGMMNSKYQTYDYRNIPLFTSYRFKDNNKVKDDNGVFMEYPISVMELNSFSYAFLKNIKKRNLEKEFNSHSSQRWNDGLGIGASLDKQTRIKNLINRIFKKNPLYASADGSLVYFLQDVLKYCEKSYKGNDFIIIGHPKIASPRTVAALETFIKNNQGRLLFKTFS